MRKLSSCPNDKGMAGVEVEVENLYLCVYPHIASNLHFCFYWMGHWEKNEIGCALSILLPDQIRWYHQRRYSPSKGCRSCQ